MWGHFSVAYLTYYVVYSVAYLTYLTAVDMGGGEDTLFHTDNVKLRQLLQIYELLICM